MVRKKFKVFSFISFVFMIGVTQNIFAQVQEPCPDSEQEEAQVLDLVIGQGDIRFEPAYFEGATIGYYLYVRKKPDIESVMVTESSGHHALRTLDWNAISGDERRELSGVQIFNIHSIFSIVSSNTIPDLHFIEAFRLFIPLHVIYGNPTSESGEVELDIKPGISINIRTFAHRYADSALGQHVNNIFVLRPLFSAVEFREEAPRAAPRVREPWQEGFVAELSFHYYIMPDGLNKGNFGEYTPDFGGRFRFGYNYHIFRAVLESGYTNISGPRSVSLIPIALKGGFNLPIVSRLNLQTDLGIGYFFAPSIDAGDLYGSVRTYFTWSFLNGLVIVFAGGGIDLIFEDAILMPAVEVGVSSRFMRFRSINRN